jgi:hypothetical protein
MEEQKEKDEQKEQQQNEEQEESSSRERIPLTKMHFLKDVDDLLISGKSVKEVQTLIRKRYGVEYSTKTYERRRKKLLTDLERVTKEPAKGTLAYELKTLGVLAEKLSELKLDSDHPEFKLVETFKTQLNSFLRRSAELFDDVDHLAYLRYALNLMQMRIAKMFELEMNMGLIMRDNTANLQALVSMVEKSIEIHQSLGLKPRFGDPKINLSVNVGAGGTLQVNELQSERVKRLRDIVAALENADPEERVRLRQELLFKRIAVEAEFEQIDQTGDANEQNMEQHGL